MAVEPVETTHEHAVNNHILGPLVNLLVNPVRRRRQRSFRVVGHDLYSGTNPNIDDSRADLGGDVGDGLEAGGAEAVDGGEAGVVGEAGLEHGHAGVLGGHISAVLLARS